jgi:hypothetical protein
MPLKFTESADGKYGADIRITLRFTADQLEKIKVAAHEDGEEWRTWLHDKASDGVYGALQRRSDSE